MRSVIPALLALVSLVACAQKLNAASDADYPLEIDHVFVIPTGTEGDLVATLAGAGFIVDPEPFEFGGGAFSRMAFLDNAYLELHFPNGSEGMPMTVGDDWAQNGATAFGVGLRRKSGGDEALPFPSKPQTEDWMPEGAVLQKLDDGSPEQPGLFVMPKEMSVRSAAARAEWRKEHAEEAASRFDHPNGARLITAVHIVTSEKGYPTSSLHLKDAGVTFEKGAAPMMTLTMDNGAQGKTLDLRPAAAVVIRY